MKLNTFIAKDNKRKTNYRVIKISRLVESLLTFDRYLKVYLVTNPLKQSRGKTSKVSGL